MRIVIILLCSGSLPLFLRWQAALVLFLAVIGFGVLTDLLYEASKRRDHIGLFLLLWILIPLPIVYYVHLPIKYLLPCMPAVILLCFRLMEGFSVRIVRVAAVVLIVASTGYSLLILRSDAEFAEVWPGLSLSIDYATRCRRAKEYGSAGSTGHIGMRH